MTIEPYAARFQIGQKVIPPKTDKKIEKPIMSMEKEAELVRARFHQVCSPRTDYAGAGGYGQEARKAEAEDRQARLEKAILAHVKATGGATRAQISARINAPPKRIGAIMVILNKSGKLIKHQRTRDGWIWITPQPKP